MDEIYPIFRRIMTGELEAAEYLENPIQCRDGRQRLIAWHNANLTDNNGLIIGTLSSGEDITERKQAEEALRASEARFRQLADAMPQLVWTANPDGGVNFRNNIHFAAYAATNQTTEGLVDWIPLLHSEDIQRTLEAWQGAIASGNSYACEHRVRMADGTMRWHLSRAEPVRDVAGSIVKWIGTTTDIQDVKQAQERLRESDERKSEFLATLAHELRNPLAPIRHAAEILRLRAPSDPGLQAAHDIIDRQIRHMVRLIDDLLEANRITRGQLRLQRERVELGVLLEQVLAIFRPQAEQAGLTLRVTLPSAPIALDADGPKGALQQTHVAPLLAASLSEWQPAACWRACGRKGEWNWGSCRSAGSCWRAPRCCSVWCRARWSKRRWRATAARRERSRCPICWRPFCSSCSASAPACSTSPWKPTCSTAVPPSLRGAILAASNFMTFGGITLASILFAGLRAPVRANSQPLLSASQIFLVCGLLTIPVCVYIVCRIPQATLRFFVWLSSLTIYRLRIYGRDNLPAEGGAVLVSNHVSWLDGFLLMLTSSRPVRPIAWVGSLQNPWVKALADLHGVIPIDAAKPKSIIRR